MAYWSLSNEQTISLPSINSLSSEASSTHNEVLGWASVAFPQMIESADAQPVVEAIGDRFKVSTARMMDVIEHTGPVLLHAYGDWVSRPDSHETLIGLARTGGPQQFADRPSLVAASVSEQEGRKFLELLFTDNNIVEQVSKQIGGRLGMPAAKVIEMMPRLAALFVGCLCKSVAT